MDPEIKGLIEEQGKTFEAFKETLDAMEAETKKFGEADVVLQEKLKKIEADFDKTEKASADLLKKLSAAEAEAEKKAAEQIDRIDKLETALNRRPSGDDDESKDLKRKYYNDWARGAVASIINPTAALHEDQIKALADSAEEMKALSVGDDTTGGFLAPMEYVNEIIKGVVEISPLRSLARVRPTNARSSLHPKRTQTGGAGWTAELGTRTETQNPLWGMEEVPNHEMYAMIDISEQNLEDSAFNLETEIREESTEQFALLEGTAFVNGNAVGKPEGILTNSSIGENVSGSAATIADTNGQADGLIDLYHALKTAYARNGTWILNRTTLGAVRKMKDSNNNYIWVGGLANLRPNTILDAPYVEMPDMPDEAADAYPIAYGDFRRGYLITDRIAMSLLRDPYTQAAGGLIRFWFRRRVGGQVMLPEAIRKLKCST